MMRRTGGWLVRGFVAMLFALAFFGSATTASAAEWVQNFVPTELWASPEANARSIGRAPQWDYFQIISIQPNDRLYVLVARSNSYAFIDAVAVGPSGAPPKDWPPLAVAPTPAPGSGQAALTLGSFPISAEAGFGPSLEILFGLRHTWTLQALTATGTHLEWGLMPADAAGLFQPGRGVITFNIRWYKSDPRALAAVIEHEAKHVADALAGLDVNSPAGCLTTEINAFREEAKTWGELVGPSGKPDPRDELERSLNFKLDLLRRNPDSIEKLIADNAGYKLQCHLP